MTAALEGEAMDAITLLEKDHRSVERLFGQFTMARDEAERRAVAGTIIKELSIHSEIEKLHLYPAVREAVPDGQTLTEHSLEEHHKVEELLAKLEGGLDKAGNKWFSDDMARLEREVTHHVKEEETELFPELRAAVPKTRLDEIGRDMAKDKDRVATHPHPSAPSQGLAHEVVGRAAGAVDRARDAVARK